MAMTMAMAMALPTGATLQLRDSVAPLKGTIVMAVPKKRTSKMKKRIRKAVWMHKADKAARQALSLAKSILTGRSNSFYYETDEPPKCSNGDYAITEEEMNDNSVSSDEQDVKQTPRGPYKRLMLLPILAYFIGRLITYISVFWSQILRKQPPGNMIPSFVGIPKNPFQSLQVEQQPL